MHWWNWINAIFYKLDDSTKQQFKIVLLEKGDFRIEMANDDETRQRLEDKERDLRREKRDERDERRREDDRDERDSRDERLGDKEDRDLRRDIRSDERDEIRVLDIEDASRKDGAKVVQWRLTREKSQRFRLILIERKSKL